MGDTVYYAKRYFRRSASRSMRRWLGFFACQSLQNYKSLPFGDEVNTALQKFMHYMTADRKAVIQRMQERLVFWIPPHDLELPCLRDLLEAALEQQTVCIVYEAMERSERNILPLGVYTVNGLWYCGVAKDMRVFRVDRVKACVPSADTNLTDNIAPHEANIRHWVMQMEDRDLVELVVELTPEGVRRCCYYLIPRPKTPAPPYSNYP